MSDLVLNVDVSDIEQAIGTLLNLKEKFGGLQDLEGHQEEGIDLYESFNEPIQALEQLRMELEDR